MYVGRGTQGKSLYLTASLTVNFSSKKISSFKKSVLNFENINCVTER